MDGDLPQGGVAAREAGDAIVPRGDGLLMLLLGTSSRDGLDVRLGAAEALSSPCGQRRICGAHAMQ